MTKQDNEVTTAPATEVSLDPQRVFESLVSELECLFHEAASDLGVGATQLYGALLMYTLGGRADLLPEVSFGMSARRRRERSVLRCARRIAEKSQNDADVCIELSSELIESHLHLIDPELGLLVA